MTSELPAPAATGSKAAVVALVLGIVAIVAALIPFLSYIAWAIGIAAIILGIVALARKTAVRRGAAITGLVLGVLAVILSIVLSVVYTTLFFIAGVASSLSSYSPNVSDLPSATSLASTIPSAGQRSVTYRVSGSGKASDITYLVADASGTGQEQVSKADLPWKKEVPVQDASAFSTTVFSLVAQRGASSGKITCEIEADGKVISKHTSSGSYAVVSCSGSAG